LGSKKGDVKGRKLLKGLAPQAGLEPATLRLTEATLKIYQARRRTMKVMIINELRAIPQVIVDERQSP
jgi:hypothetical protein